MASGTFLFTDFSGQLLINDNLTSSRSFTLGVTGFWAKVVNVSITLDGLNHTLPDDLDFLFLGPGGTNLEFWSDAGGNNAIANGNFIIADSGTSLLPDDAAIASATYRPSDYEIPGESSNNWGLAPNITINHPGPNGTATFASA